MATPSTNMDNILQCIDEVLIYTLKFLDIKSLLTFTQCYNKIYLLSQDLPLWKFLIQRDYPELYEKYRITIIKKNEVDAKFRVTISSINSIFENISLELLTTQLNSLQDFVEISETDSNPIEETIENINREIADLKDMILDRYQRIILPKPLKNQIEENPFDLYKIFFEQAHPIFCQYRMARGRNKGAQCKNTVNKGKFFCKQCSTKKAVHIQMNPIPQIPFGFPPIPFGMPQIPILPPQPGIDVILLDEGSYITARHNFVIDAGFNLLGVKEGDEVRQATDEEKFIARDMVIKVD